MSIESGNDPRLDSNPFKHMETVGPPVEHRDDERGENARAELARMKEAEERRRRRNRRAGVGALVATAVSLGGFFGIKSLGSGEEEPSPEPTQPAATGAAVPGVENPPAETNAPVETAAAPSSPADIYRLGETLENGEPLFSNEAIREWFHVDSDDFFGASAKFFPVYMSEHGASDNYVPNADQHLDSIDPTLGFANPGYPDVDNGNEIVAYFEDIELKFLVGGNMVLSSPELYDGSQDPHFGEMALRGTFGEAIDEIVAEGGVDCESGCINPMDDASIRKFVSEINKLPEGSIITDVVIDQITYGYDYNNFESGVGIQATARTPEGENILLDIDLDEVIPVFAPVDSERLESNYTPSINGPDAKAYLKHVPAEQQ